MQVASALHQVPDPALHQRVGRGARGSALARPAGGVPPSTALLNDGPRGRLVSVARSRIACPRCLLPVSNTGRPSAAGRALTGSSRAAPAWPDSTDPPPLACYVASPRVRSPPQRLFDSRQPALARMRCSQYKHSRFGNADARELMLMLIAHGYAPMHDAISLSTPRPCICLTTCRSESHGVYRRAVRSNITIHYSTSLSLESRETRGPRCQLVYSPCQTSRLHTPVAPQLRHSTRPTRVRPYHEATPAQGLIRAAVHLTSRRTSPPKL